jgi:hypothetical protein
LLDLAAEKRVRAILEQARRVDLGDTAPAPPTDVERFNEELGQI